MQKTILKIAKFVAIALLCVSCGAPPPIKTHPEYKGVAPQAKPLVDEYLWLSAQNHIEFDAEVTVGFKHINYGAVVGICNYGETWREIDIDVDYWNSSTNLTRAALLFHELTHCYCGRDHDFGKDQKYSDSETLRDLQAVRHAPGYFDDECPTSLMFPQVTPDDCMKAHYDQYVKEMFDRCEPI